MTDLSAVDRRTLLKAASLSLLSAAHLSGPRRSAAEVPRVLPIGKTPNDARLGPLKSLDGYFPWTPSTTVEEWKQRSEYVRRQILVACGLWPMPTKKPLKATVHGKVERPGYSVERVILETADGLYCTGSLYRPARKAEGKIPAVVCPHGHWLNGRFYEHTADQFQKELASKAETMPCGRYPLQARCVQLARMGCLVFLYDMLGYADNVSVPYEVSHRFATQRDDLSSPDRWGLFSAQSELRCLNVIGLQTWNSIRALDWISSLDDVDTQRIGVTGASGGGTQTFLLGAIDPRPAAFFPSVMVSTAMQGGCTCENASLLRVGTGNIEFAALLAPKPLGMTGADDWTVDIETKGLPQLKQHYAMLGVPDNVEGKYLPFPHNYNQPSRMLMYEFFNKHLKLGQQSPIVETEFEPLTKQEATVWNDEHPAPPSDVENERRILQGFAEDHEGQFAALIPTDPASFAKYREVIGGAWDVIIGRKLPGKDEVTHESEEALAEESLQTFKTLIRLTKHNEEIPTLIYLPKNWNKHVVIWLSDEGKTSLLTQEGRPIPAVRQLIDAGISVAIPDLLYQGEFLAGGPPLKQYRRVPNPREFVGYTLGYNHSLFAQRVHDVLTMVAFCRFSKYEPLGVHLVGLGRTAGPIAAAAAFQSGLAVDNVAIGTGQFRFASLTDAYDPMLVPGAVKYGDVPGLLALAAPRPLWLSGEGTEPPAVVRAAYQSDAAPKIVISGPTKVETYAGPAQDEAVQAATWILKSILKNIA